MCYRFLRLVQVDIQGRVNRRQGYIIRLRNLPNIALLCQGAGGLEGFVNIAGKRTCETVVPVENCLNAPRPVCVDKLGVLVNPFTYWVCTDLKRPGCFVDRPGMGALHALFPCQSGNDRV